VRATAPSAAGSQASLDQIVRFTIVGCASALLYLVLTIALQRSGAALAAASLVAYVASGAFSFFGHRAFTFASRGALFVEAARFAALNLAGLAVALGTPIVLTDRLGFPLIFAVLVSCVIAPIANYLAMRSLVFYRVRHDAHPAQ